MTQREVLVVLHAGRPTNRYTAAAVARRLAADGVRLRMLDDAGNLRPAQLDFPTPLAAGPLPGCGWSIGERTAVELAAPLSSREWTVRLDYVADRDGVVEVALDDGAAVSAPVVAGAHSIYLRVTGGGSALSVSAPGLCVGDGVVGIPGPR